MSDKYKISDKTCGECEDNDNGLCDMLGVLVEDEDTCKIRRDCNGCFGAAGDDCQRCQDDEKENNRGLRMSSAYKNGEGYSDPTAGSAWSNIKKEEHRKEAERMAVIGNLIPVMKQTAELAGFEVVGRIVLKDKSTGKEYR